MISELEGCYGATLDNYKPGKDSDITNRFFRRIFGRYRAFVHSLAQIKGLPETMPERVVKDMLFAGWMIMTDKCPGGINCFRGGLGGELDEHNEPTIITVANPYLRWDATLKIGEDCVLINGDSARQGIWKTLQDYCMMLAINEVSMMSTGVLSRMQLLPTETNDAGKKSWEMFTDRLWNGELATVRSVKNIATAQDGLTPIPLEKSGKGSIIDYIEYHQYLLGLLNHAIGVQSSYNMKRESINEAEAGLSEASLLPFTDDMFAQWQLGFDEANAKYGTNIEVVPTSAWELLRKEIDLSLQEEETDSEEEVMEDDPEPEDE